MIDSKKLGMITVVLIAAAAIFVMLFSIRTPFNPVFANDERLGRFTYGDGCSATFTRADYEDGYISDAAVQINCFGKSAECVSNAVSIDGGMISILKSGMYMLSGTLDDGYVYINTTDGGSVHLILDNVSITSSRYSALVIKSTGKTVITLMEDTVNTFTDGSEYDSSLVSTSGKPDACIYSTGDITINGSGTLNVTGNREDGIRASTLKLLSGNISVTAADDGIASKSATIVRGGEINVSSGDDGIKAEYNNSDYGFVAIESGNVGITSGSDGIYGTKNVYVSGGNVKIVSGGGSGAASYVQKSDSDDDSSSEGTSDEEPVSKKGISSINDIEISGGTISIDSCDDAIHSDDDAEISAADLTLKSGEDGIHADDKLVIDSGNIDIQKCREGLDAEKAEINGGYISIVSENDGIAITNGGTYASKALLCINGGGIYIETGADGIDVSASAEMNGGNIVIYGPENNEDGALSFGGGFTVNGGTLIFAGSSAAVQVPKSDTLNGIEAYFGKLCSSGAEVALKDSDGNDVITFTPTKSFDWLYTLSADIITGEVYYYSVNGESTESTAASGTASVIGSLSDAGTVIYDTAAEDIESTPEAAEITESGTESAESGVKSIKSENAQTVKEIVSGINPLSAALLIISLAAISLAVLAVIGFRRMP